MVTHCGTIDANNNNIYKGHCYGSTLWDLTNAPYNNNNSKVKYLDNKFVSLRNLSKVQRHLCSVPMLNAEGEVNNLSIGILHKNYRPPFCRSSQ